MKSRLVLGLGLFVACSLVTVNSQTASSTPPSAEYKAGQVWNYQSARGAEESKIVILDVQPDGKKGKLVHIRIENIPIPNCAGFHLTTAGEHLAVPDKVLRKSTTDLAQDRTDLPDGYFAAYKEWQKSRHREVTKRPLAEVALPGGCPVIINLRQKI